MPAASSFARLILKPDDKRSTDSASRVCAVPRLRRAIMEAILVFKTDEGVLIAAFQLLGVTAQFVVLVSTNQ